MYAYIVNTVIILTFIFKLNVSKVKNYHASTDQISQYNNIKLYILNSGLLILLASSQVKETQIHILVI